MGCPTPKKRAYRDELAAKIALARYIRGGFDDLKRPYPCPCGKWHLTTKRRGGRKEKKYGPARISLTPKKIG